MRDLCFHGKFVNTWPDRCANEAKYMGTFTTEDGRTFQRGLCAVHRRMVLRDGRAWTRDSKVNDQYPYCQNGTWQEDEA